MAEQRKWGAGHAAAMGRLGLKELRNALNPSKESVADTEVGLYGTATQMEVNQGRGNMGVDNEQQRTSVLGYPLQAEPEQGRTQQQAQTQGQEQPRQAQQQQQAAKEEPQQGKTSVLGYEMGNDAKQQDAQQQQQQQQQQERGRGR